MNIFKINNTLNFQGSREIVFKEALANGGKIKKPFQDMLTQSQLQVITKSLMDDLDCIALPSISVGNKISMDKMYTEQAIKTYKSIIEKSK